MKSQYKPFLISILCEIIFALFFYSTNGLWYNFETIFFNHIFEWVFIAIIRPFIWLIRNTKEKNTKYLKITLIIIEIYLFLLIFVQDWSNLSKREFFILYLSILWLIKESIYKRFKKRQTIFFTSFYSIVVSIIICIWCLMRYREDFDIQDIINQQEYLFITHFDWTLNKKYSSITLSNEKYTENIDPTISNKRISIKKNKDYILTFSTQNVKESNYIIIQDQLGNLLQVLPQTSINFSTNKTQIQFRDNERKTKYYAINTEFPENLNYYKTNYEESIKKIILLKLPPMLRNNSKFQKITYKFTKYLSNLLPFWYKNNWIIADKYYSYLTIQEEKNYNWISNKYKLLKENENIWIENINGLSKYKEYIKNFFN